MADKSFIECMRRLGKVLAGQVEDSVAAVSLAAKEVSIGLTLRTAYDATMPEALPEDFLELLNRLEAEPGTKGNGHAGRH